MNQSPADRSFLWHVGYFIKTILAFVLAAGIIAICAGMAWVVVLMAIVLVGA